MKKMELIAPCHFGLEAVLKREILDLGYDISEVEDGRVGFWGDAEAIVKAVTNFEDYRMLAELSEDLGEAMVGKE